ncbi:hypothetical protein BH18ACT8_BH18ACT8_12010 [soil metagenome]
MSEVLRHSRDRKDAIRDRREAFELETLVACSAALRELGASSAAVVSQPTDSPELEHARAEYLQKQRNVGKLVPLLLDDRVRKAAETAMQAWSELVAGETSAAIFRPAFWLRGTLLTNGVHNAQDQTKPAHDPIGERVRGLYKGTVTNPRPNSPDSAPEKRITSG